MLEFVYSLPRYVWAVYTRWTRLGSWSIGGGRNSSRSTTENIAVLAPIPRARVSVTAMVNAGLLRRPRTAYRRSWTRGSQRKVMHDRTRQQAFWLRAPTE